MNFLNPAIFGHLPPSARCSLVAVYSFIVAEAQGRRKDSAKRDEPLECHRSQTWLAAWIGCDVSTVKRHERKLVRVGLLTVERGRKSNRRILTVLPVRKRPRAEWGQNCHQSGGRPDTTQPQVHTNARGRAGASPLQRENSLSRSERAPHAERKASPSERVLRGATAQDEQRIQAGIARLVSERIVFRQHLRELAELVSQLAALQGPRRTIEDLDYIRARNERIIDAGKRAASTLKWFRVKVGRLEEKAGPRVGGLSAVGS